MTDFYIPERKIGEAKIPPGKTNKDEMSSWSIFFGVLLAVVLVVMYERAFYDLPRFFNPFYENCQSANAAVVLKLCQIIKYETVRLLLHIALVVPLLIVTVVISLTTMRKKIKNQSKILMRAFYFSVFVAAVHLFIEFATFLFRHYRELGIYVILISFAVAFIVLIVYLQKRFNRPKPV
ncbi:MAG: hypothetical protein ABIH38_04830 [Patescibacteria group bacterium]